MLHGLDLQPLRRPCPAPDGRTGGVARRWLAILLLSLTWPGLRAQDTRDGAMFAAWQARHADAVDAFRSHLASADLLEVVALPELLKSASSWSDCQAEPFAVPPPPQWPAVLSVLRLVRELKRQRVLGDFTVHSGYREPRLNDCAGGAMGSAHLRSFAIDLTPREDSDLTPGLCAFWREQGSEWNMGFSRYPSGRLHLDTAGHRTWGHDHTGRSAVCTAAQPEGQPLAGTGRAAP